MYIWIDSIVSDDIYENPSSGENIYIYVIGNSACICIQVAISDKIILGI